MKKINVKDYFNTFLGIVVSLLFLKSCGDSKNVRTLNAKVDSLQSQIKTEYDSLRTQNITEAEMKKLIKETPAYETLILEELSDKNHVPINELRIKSEVEKKQP